MWSEMFSILLFYFLLLSFVVQKKRHDWATSISTTKKLQMDVWELYNLISPF